MKFRVMGGPLPSSVSIEAKHSDSFKTILKKVQKAAGKKISIEGYRLFTSTTSPTTGELVPAAGPLLSKDTPESLSLDRKQKDPHVLLLVPGGARDEGDSSTHRSPSHSTTATNTAGDVGSQDGGTSSASLTPASTPRAAESYRRRMQALFLKYDPEKINKVDLALERYAGYEEDVIQQLVKKYGPEPAADEVDTSPAAVARALSAAAERSSLNASQAAPGDYGKNPNRGASYHDRLVAIYSTYEPEKLSKVDGTLKRYAGREEEVIQQLLKKYGPEPKIGTAPPLAAPAVAAPTENVATTLSAQTPAAAASIVVEEPGVASEAPETPGYELSPMTSSVAADSVPITPRNLQDDYDNSHAAGADTSAMSSGTAAAETPAAATSRGPLTYRDRLTAMYATYDPSKIRLVDGTLKKYKGREAAVLKQLVKMYGPEPSPEHVAAAKEAAVAASRARRADVSASASVASSAAKPPASPVEPAADATAAVSEAVQPAETDEARTAGQSVPGVEVSTSSPLTATEEQQATVTPISAAVAEAVTVVVAPMETASPISAATAPAAASSPLSPPSEKAPAPTVEEPVSSSSSSSEEGDRYRERLVALYNAYNPSKLHTVEGTLRKFAGKEEAAIQQLVRRYGPEPPALTTEEAYELLKSASGSSPMTSPRTHNATSAAATAASGDTADALSSPPSSKPASPVESAGGDGGYGSYRERIHSILATHDPEKVDRVGAILERYQGKEEEVIAKLEQRYGVRFGGDGDDVDAEKQPSDVSDATAGTSPAAGAAVAPPAEQEVAVPEVVVESPASVVDVHTSNAVDADPPRPVTPPPAPVSVEVVPSVEMVSAASPITTATPVVSSTALHGVPEAVVKGEAPLSEDDATRPTAPPSQRSSSCDSVHHPSTPNVASASPSDQAVEEEKKEEQQTLPQEKETGKEGHANPAPSVMEPHIPASPPAARAKNYTAAAKVAAQHLEAHAHKSLLQRYWSAWSRHHVEAKAAALVRDELWVAVPAAASTSYQLNDAVDPPYVVSDLTRVAAQEVAAASVFSSEVVIATRTLLSALRHCVASRVVEVRSAEEQELAEQFLSHWKVAEHLCPVRDSPELARALHQAAHLIAQLDDLMTVIRTQAGQLQQLKSLHKDVLQRMESAQASAGDVDRLQAQLDDANARRRELEEELRRVATHAGVSARVRAGNGDRKASPPVRHVYPTAEERKDAQIAKLQQELAKTRTSLFASKEAEEKMKVQVQQSIAREARRERDDRRREGVSGGRSRPVSLAPQSRSHSGPAGQRGHLASATPRGAFSHAIALEGTPRRPSESAARVDHNGRAVSSIRKPGTDGHDRSNVSLNSSTPWPTTRFVMTEEVERGPCPNCLTPLTSCSAEASGPANAKAAFCFSCRRSFTFGELRARDARDAMEGL